MDPVLKSIFDEQAKSSLDEEQMQRMLGPVVTMINEGKFSKKSHIDGILLPSITGLSVAILIAVVALTQIW